MIRNVIMFLFLLALVIILGVGGCTILEQIRDLESDLKELSAAPVAQLDNSEGLSILSVDKCLEDLVSGANTSGGEWSVISEPSGSAIVIPANNCPTLDSCGLYTFQYKLCPDDPDCTNCCDSIQTCYYLIEPSNVEVADLEVCNDSPSFVMLDSFPIADLSSDAEFLFIITSPDGLSTRTSSNVNEPFFPSDGVGCWDISFTVTPVIDATCNGDPIALPPECIPVTYNYQICVLCCNGIEGEIICE